MDDERIELLSQQLDWIDQRIDEFRKTQETCSFKEYGVLERDCETLNRWYSDLWNEYQALRDMALQRAEKKLRSWTQAVLETTR